MIRKFVDFALNNRILIVAFAVLLFIWGGISFHQLPVEAYPDVANNYVEVITQCSRAALPRRSRTAGNDSARNRDERHPASSTAAFALHFDLPIRSLQHLKMTFDDERRKMTGIVEEGSRTARAGHPCPPV